MAETNGHMTVKNYRSVQEALDELERELNVRSRCFPRWIEDGRVSRTDAQDRLDRLATAFKLLEQLHIAPGETSVGCFWQQMEPVLSAEPEAKAK